LKWIHEKKLCRYKEIIPRWGVYIRKLYGDEDRGVQYKIQKNMNGATTPGKLNQTCHAEVDEPSFKMSIALNKYGNKLYGTGTSE